MKKISDGVFWAMTWHGVTRFVLGLFLFTQGLIQARVGLYLICTFYVPIIAGVFISSYVDKKLLELTKEED